jgi:translation initiation factor 4B
MNIRIMKDRIDNRSKGFGYVEFSDLESLKRALSLSEGQLAGRNVRVSVAEPRILRIFPCAHLEAKSGMSSMDDASSQGEWRSGKVLPAFESRTGRNFSGDSIVRNERREMNLASVESGVDRWERKGPLPPAPPRETGERRSPSVSGSRSTSGQFTGLTTRIYSQESAADVNEWRSSRPVAPTVPAPSDGSKSPTSVAHHL